MAALPEARVVPSKVFQVTGVDYADPFPYLLRGGNHKVVQQAYIVVFVCFSIKTIYLELVTSLSIEVFLAALERFVARLGLLNEI